MTVNYTTNLALGQPVTGTESGTWGDDVNNAVTSYLDIAISGSLALTSASFTANALTLTNTQGNSSATNIGATTAQYYVLRLSSLAASVTITAPSVSKTYLVVNADPTYSVTVKASGQTGISVAPGERATVYYNGTDYIKVTSSVVSNLTGVLPVANGGTGVTTSTGSGNNVLSTSPTFVTPILGTPTSATLTNATGLPLTTGVTGTLPVANGGTGVTTSTGSGSVVLSTSPTLVTPALGTPASGVLTNATGLPLTSGVTGTLPVANGGTGVTTSTGSGSNVLSTSPTLVTPLLGTPTSGNFSTGTFTWPTFNQNTSGTAAGLSATLAVASGGTGVTTSTGSGSNVLSTSPTLVTPLLGTPTSGNLANCTFPTLNQNTTGTAAGLSATLAVASGGTGVTTSTGSGSVVLSTSPTLVTPLLGTPTSGNLANCTFPTLNQNTTGTAAGLSATLAVASGGTGAATLTANNVLLGNGTSALQTIAPSTSGNVLTSNGTTWASTAPTAPYEIFPITASVASSALTATLNPIALDFRSSTLTSGTVNRRTVSSAISVVVPSTATLGTLNATQSRIIVLAIDNAGTVELAVVNIAGGNNLDETTLISTTAISTAADSDNVIYSTTARTSVAFRVVGYIESTQATAGTWATAPSTIQGAGGNAARSMSSLGYGQTWQNVTASRAVATTYYNTTGKPILVHATFRGNAGPLSDIQLTINGTIANSVTCTTTNYYVTATGIVPPGGTYIVSVSASVTLNNWAELR